MTERGNVLPPAPCHGAVLAERAEGNARPNGPPLPVLQGDPPNVYPAWVTACAFLCGLLLPVAVWVIIRLAGR
jgi:hypothetical protein